MPKPKEARRAVSAVVSADEATRRLGSEIRILAPWQFVLPSSPRRLKVINRMAVTNGYEIQKKRLGDGTKVGVVMPSGLITHRNATSGGVGYAMTDAHTPGKVIRVRGHAKQFAPGPSNKVASTPNLFGVAESKKD